MTLLREAHFCRHRKRLAFGVVGICKMQSYAVACYAACQVIEQPVPEERTDAICGLILCQISSLSHAQLFIAENN